MKKKNLLTAAASLALVAVVGVGATLAYFTDKTDTKTNVFKTGNVNIDLIDECEVPEDAGWGALTRGDGVTYFDVMPGDLLDKHVSLVVDKGSADCYAAIRVTVTSDTEKPDANEMMGLVTEAVLANEADLENPTWYPVEDYDAEGNLEAMVYIYKEPVTDLSKGNELVLFENVQIPAAWNNAYSNAEFDIAVTGYAAQASNISMEDFAAMITNGTMANGDGFAGFEQVA